RRLAHELAALRVVLVREEDVHGNIDVSVERVAVGERELRALGDDVHELGLGEFRDVEALEERELLETDGARTPGTRLADREPAVLVGADRLDRRLPLREVLACEQAALGRTEAVDLVGDEPLVEEPASTLDLLLARPAAALLRDPSVGRCQGAV